jgi:hypothetical protein
MHGDVYFVEIFIVKKTALIYIAKEEPTQEAFLFHSRVSNDGRPVRTWQ